MQAASQNAYRSTVMTRFATVCTSSLNLHWTIANQNTLAFIMTRMATVARAIATPARSAPGRREQIARPARTGRQIFRPRGARPRIGRRAVPPQAPPPGDHAPLAGRGQTGPGHARAIARAVSCRRRSCRLSGVRGAEQAANRRGKLLPDGALLGERAGSACSQGINAPVPSGLRGNPPARQQTGLLETMQRRIDGALGEVEGLTTATANFLNDRVAVRRPRGQRGKDDHVEMPLEHFAFHAIPFRVRPATSRLYT